jgi:hypothetical protein
MKGAAMSPESEPVWTGEVFVLPPVAEAVVDTVWFDEPEQTFAAESVENPK